MAITLSTSADTAASMRILLKPTHFSSEAQSISALQIYSVCPDAHDAAP
jgi:hypothetical protein